MNNTNSLWVNMEQEGAIKPNVVKIDNLEHPQEKVLPEAGLYRYR